MNISIAIDGPCGAGKSTVALAVAERLGGHYLDTGAMYRAVGLYMLSLGIAPDDAEKVPEALKNCLVDVSYDQDNRQHTLLNGKDVSGEIRTPEVSMAASAVGTVKAVRVALVARQRELAQRMFLVCDGRDIGTCVIPDALLKIYLTAAAEERARRRLAQMNDPNASFEQVLEDVNKRDYNDMHRAESPLTQAEDAVVVDTTHMDFDQVVDTLVKLYLDRLNKIKL
jgi:cytidylate kinase